MELGALGPGFPLFFILMQYLIFYLFGLTIIYFLPNYFNMTSAVEKLQKYDYVVESDLAMISYGAFVMGAIHGNETHDYKAIMTKENFFEDQQDNINFLGYSFAYSILYSLVAFFFMRK
jgi:hypothetical protein